ncbi:DNA-binding MarR family transcriptional regulator [Geodermatophilus bullaregiensis]|uniref:MarR family winged helix-turn-helix transcriptional regulator n=1 Tax=Geodermatophilus bullaregiensis TaxID=1564160 RepID=UPI00195DE40E|nr:MarR family transcriptional regulator [Geodermatophilus bullaregiensis]MBM7806620.1 DNA-binding MarR family transcriptional regulator [Geodermatophilus bullaregiensis]
MAGRDGVDAIVEQWAVERPDLDTAAMAVFGRVYRVARLVGDAQERCYARFGLTRADFDVLATLRRAGTPDGLSPGRLTAALMLSSGGMTSRLDRLERAGHLVRTPDPTDRRALLVRLTDSGRALVDEAVGAGLAEQQRMLGDLDPDRVRRLDGDLRDLLASVERHVAPE